jgi:alanine-synthesizing transaminase
LFSKRINWNTPTNRLTRARQRCGAGVLDLTQSNPTRASLDYPVEELTGAMARAARMPYTPDPLGLPAAREAVAAMLRCSAEDILITASTSEAYAFLFKLLCNAGEEILTGTPSYPLLEHISALELVSIRAFPLEFHGRWELHADRLRGALTDRVRGVVVVNPNNPTGSFVRSDEQQALADLPLPIISDEVFLDYALESRGTTFTRDDVLTFVLGGLSKSAGLPHYKLGWIRVSGPEAARREALAALALIADNFLSVATPVQAALPDILAIAPRVRAAICERLRRNLAALDRALTTVPAAQRLPVEGGWSAVLRIPSTESDEDFAVRLLEERGVFVHPGYLFDFAAEGYLVVSLLTEPEIFDQGMRRIVDMIAQR